MSLTILEISFAVLTQVGIFPENTVKVLLFTILTKVKNYARFSFSQKTTDM